MFHNHDEEGNDIYRYPRVQYKRIHAKAAIVGVKDGIEAINELFSAGNHIYKIGKREVEMHIESLKAYDNEIGFCDSPLPYRLLNWLPLNSKNYREYQSKEGLADKISFLEDILTGNLLSFFSSIGYHVEEQIKPTITEIKAQRIVTYKHVKLMAFDIEFKVNLTLPQYIGIGKSASVGFGTLTKITQ